MPLAPRAMVISLQKSGTHLMQELMLELGLQDGRGAPPAPHTGPRFTGEQARIAGLVLSKVDYDELLERRARRTSPTASRRPGPPWCGTGTAGWASRS